MYTIFVSPYVMTAIEKVFAWTTQKVSVSCRNPERVPRTIECHAAKVLIVYWPRTFY